MNLNSSASTLAKKTSCPPEVNLAATDLAEFELKFKNFLKESDPTRTALYLMNARVAGVAFRDMKPTDQRRLKALNETWDGFAERSDALMDHAQSFHATTLAGLRAKARFSQWLRSSDPYLDFSAMADLIDESILKDLLSITAEA